MIDARSDDEAPAVLRHAGVQRLSLALMQARNRTLQWWSAFEAAGVPRLPAADRSRLSPPQWLAGHAGWFHEYWIARHVQRSRGDRADANAVRLASVEPQADRWWHPAQSTVAERWAMDLPVGDALRGWLVGTLETTLELLAHAAEDDDALLCYRAALHHELQLSEAFAVLAQASGLTREQVADLWSPLPVRAPRAPIGLPGRRWSLGSERGGFVPEFERWAHQVLLQACEIDAQPVAWDQYAEFVEDGGYDERRWWSDAGWAWLQAEVATHGPRCPRHVDQIRRGVVMHELGRLTRLPATQAVRHVSAHEADAWCRWAGRRLPTEAEWELAASTATARGFVWGDVREWVAGSARLYPGYEPGLFARPAPAPGTLRVLRGASWLTPPMLRHAKARRFAVADRDERFCGFRSCAL